MKRILTAVDLMEWLPANANAWQDRSLGLVAALKNNDLDASYNEANIGVIWQAKAPLVDAHIIQITSFADDGIDWRDRDIVGHFYLNSGADNNRIGQATDYNLDSQVAGAGFNLFGGYLGTGGVSDLATGAAVSNTNPPIRGAGAHRSYFVNAGAAGAAYLYADPADGSLWLYNHSGASISPKITIIGEGKSGKR